MYKHIYLFIITICFILFFVDEISFILYNVSIYQVFCGSNLLIAYENLVKIPLDFSAFYYLENSFLFSFSSDYYSLSQFFFFTNLDSITVQKPVNNVSGLMSNFTFAVEQMENTYLVYFDTLVNRKNLVDFEVLQNKLYVGPGETTLAFFRVINKTENYLNGFSLYVVNPHEYTPFINKIQCFCYEELMIYPEESIDLPVLFYLDPEIKNSLFSTKEIVIEYILIL